LIRALTLFVILLMPIAAIAQEDDRGRLVQFLEGALSDGRDRQVQITGFRGALSTTASLDQMTISDEAGVWLTLENAELNWNRSAILSRRIEITTLVAERLILHRAPLAQDVAPEAEPSPFQLPELPISVEIAELRIDQLDLDASLLGEAASLRLEGQASLAAGAGDWRLQLDRIDDKAGTFAVSGAYANETGDLELALSLTEAADGIAARLMSLPGTPSLEFSIAGVGTLSNFPATLELSTDGQQRMVGSIALTEAQDTSRRIEVDVSGDITPLVLPQYRDFFGPDVVLTFSGAQSASGQFAIESLLVKAASLTLSGQLLLDQNRVPASFLLDGSIQDPSRSSAPVVLPFGDTPITVKRVDLEIAYDRASGDEWRGDFTISDLLSSELRVEQSVLSVAGSFEDLLNPAAGLQAIIQGQITGLEHSDPAIAEALGTEVTLRGAVDWQEGAPITISNLDLAGETLNFRGDASALPENGLLTVDFAAETSVANIAPFSSIAGSDLSGRITARLEGQIEALSGAFGVTLSGEAEDLVLSDAAPADLLAGITEFSGRLDRNGQGLSLDRLLISGTELSAAVSGTVSSTAGELSAAIQLRDAGLLTSALRGPLSLNAGLSRQDESEWTVDVSANGPGGLNVDVQGQVGQPNGAVDLVITGQGPLALADQFISPRSLRGTANIQLDLQGAPTLANLRGQLTSSGFRASAPTLQFALENGAAQIALNGGVANLDVTTDLSSGGQVGVSGTIDLAVTSLPANLVVSLTNVVLVDPQLFQARVDSGQITINGPLTSGARIDGDVLLGPTELRIPDAAVGTSEAIPEIRHIGEGAAQRRTRGNAGLLDQASGGSGTAYPLNLRINAPGRIFLRGRGLDAELGGQLRLEGTTADMIPSGTFDLVRGRLDILGRRLNMTEGYGSLRGTFDTVIRLVAESRTDDLLIFVIVEGPATSPTVRFSSQPELPEDEILAQFFFGRDLSSLSAIQALQLAGAVAELAGQGSSGLLSNLRQNLNLDELDFQTDAAGNAAVRAGRYVSENIYSEVTVGAGGDAEISLNVDLSPSVTARGSFASDGESGLGVFFERDY
jgi:translocation and assembly module TamB